VARLAGEHAEAVRPNRRFHIDFPTGAGARQLRRVVCPPVVITNADFRFVVAEQLRERGIEADIVLEPERRDSGLAVAVSAVLAAERNRDALVLAADHVVRKPDEFREACQRAATAAANGRIVTFGIEPTHPATNYGYIRRFEPAMAEAAKAAVHGLTRDLDFLRLAAEPFARAPKKSIDYAVMERTKLAAVVPTDVGWSDIGSWSTVWHVLNHDSAGNATDGPVVMLDSRNNLVCSEESILTTVVGLDEMIVVSTTDAVLVSAREGGAGENAGRAAQGTQLSRRGRAPPQLPSVGLLPGCRQRSALPIEAHCREAGQQALAAEALPSLGALGCRQGNG
jgi:mannose-1-phosphate guanylyltransferase